MPSTITDRLNGLTTSVAVKAPCLVATSANITLSGEQTIDGVAVVAGDRVLVKSQTNSVDNGIYVAATSTWTRATDFDGSLDLVKGTVVSVISGATNENSYWRVTSADDVAVGADAINFAAGLINDAEAIIANLPGFPGINKTLGDALPYINPGEFFGITSDGATDDTLALAAAIEAVSNNSRHRGTKLRLKPGGLTITEAETVVEPFVDLDLGGGELRAELSGGNDAALRILSNTITQNGLVRVASGGSPGIQASAHCPVMVGERYGAQDGNGDYYTLASPSPFDVVRNFMLLNLSLISNKNLGVGATAGSAGVAIQGDVAVGLVAYCRVLANAQMTAGFVADWGERGSNAAGTAQGIISAANQQQNNRDNVDAARAISTHPHDILHWHCVVEALTRPYAGTATTGSFGFRFAGSYRIGIRHGVVHSATEAAFAEHAGDVGGEFASDVDYKGFAEGHHWEDISVLEASTGDAMQSDDTGDNLVDSLTTDQLDADGNLTGLFYTPERSTSFPSSSLWRKVSGYCTAGASARYGLNVFDKHKGTYEDISMSGFKVGARFSGAHNVTLSRARLTFNREENILIEDSSRDIQVLETQEASYANRAAGGHSNVRIRTGSRRIEFDGGDFGAEAADESAVHNFLIVNSEFAGDVALRNLAIHSAAGGGYGLVAGSSGTWGALRLVENIRWGDFLPNLILGQAAIPVAKELGADATLHTVWRAASGVTMDGFTGEQGDYIKFDDFTAGGKFGTGFTVAGTQGTLAGVTGGITSGTKALTVNTTAGLAIGQYITIAGVTGTKQIVDIVALAVTIDSNADATVAAAAVAYANGTTKDFGEIDA